MREDKSLNLRGLSSAIDVGSWYEMLASFDEYLATVKDCRSAAYSAHQRLYHSIIVHGKEEYRFAKRKVIHYKFFEDPFENGKDAIYGLDPYLSPMVKVFKSASVRNGQHQRVFLLHGPVGSSKSTIARLLCKGLEHYTRTDEGRLYTFSWIPEDDEDRALMGLTDNAVKSAQCKNHEDPLLLLPLDVRAQVMEMFNNGVEDPTKLITIEGSSCSFCRFVKRGLEKKYRAQKNIWRIILDKHVRVERFVFSEEDRIGIGSFRPKDQKSQDATELCGDVSYGRIAKYGESDPRAFDFHGEFSAGSRGFVNFDEMIKLATEFLYDLLGVSQEHKFKPKKLSQNHVDTVVIGSTNDEEYKKLVANDGMKAFRDRLTVIPIPYVLRHAADVHIYSRTYRRNLELPLPAGHKHLAPHTLQMASLWSLLTRVMPSQLKHNLKLREKVKLYDGRKVGDFNDDELQELMREFPNEGFHGISPRFIQDKVGNAVVGESDKFCTDFFEVRKELEEGLKTHSILTETEKESCVKLFSDVSEEYDEIVKGEVQQAIGGDEREISVAFNKYMENVVAFVNKEKLENRISHEMVDPDEKFMSEIEMYMGVNKNNATEVRRGLVQAMGGKLHRKESFDLKSNDELRRALELALFERKKDWIKLTSLNAQIVPAEDQANIEIIKKRMIDRFGYCENCATVVMHHVASIFSRGESKKR